MCEFRRARVTRALPLSQHDNVVRIKEMVTGSTLEKVFMVMEFLEYSVSGLMTSLPNPFSQAEVRCATRAGLREC